MDGAGTDEPDLRSTPVPWTVVAYHSLLAVISLLFLISALLDRKPSHLDAKRLMAFAVALLCTLFLGWTAWGIAYRQVSAIRWAYRFHLLITVLGPLFGAITYYFLLDGLKSDGSEPIVGVIIFLIGVVAPLSILTAASWASWRVLRMCRRQSCGLAEND